MLVAIKVKNLIDGVNDNVIHNKVVRIKNGIIYEIIDSDNFVPINNENVFATTTYIKRHLKPVNIAVNKIRDNFIR